MVSVSHFEIIGITLTFSERAFIFCISNSFNLYYLFIFTFLRKSNFQRKKKKEKEKEKKKKNDFVP